MRTVSFSDRKVRSLLNQDFVNTFTNTTGDPTAGKSIWHQPDDLPGSCTRGVGGQNVQTLFLTPEGKIFHAANGYLSAEDLLEEANFAKDLFTKMEKASGPVNEVVRQAHRERLEELGFDSDQIEAAQSGSPFSTFNLVTESEPGNIFAGKTKKEVLMGNAFSIKHPLMDYRTFEKDPTPLVGSGKSSFVSTSSNGKTPENRSQPLDGETPSKEEEKKNRKRSDELSELLKNFPSSR